METANWTLISVFQSDLRSLMYLDISISQYPIKTTSLAGSIRQCSCLSVVCVLVDRLLVGLVVNLFLLLAPASRLVSWFFFFNTVKKRPCGAFLTVYYFRQEATGHCWYRFSALIACPPWLFCLGDCNCAICHACALALHPHCLAWVPTRYRLVWVQEPLRGRVTQGPHGYASLPWREVALCPVLCCLCLNAMLCLSGLHCVRLLPWLLRSTSESWPLTLRCGGNVSARDTLLG